MCRSRGNYACPRSGRALPSTRLVQPPLVEDFSSPIYVQAYDVGHRHCLFSRLEAIVAKMTSLRWLWVLGIGCAGGSGTETDGSEPRPPQDAGAVEVSASDAAPVDRGAADGGGGTVWAPGDVGSGIAAADKATFTRFMELGSIAGSGVPPEGTPLIGRNRTWGDLYSPRFQVGAGFAVRIAAAAREGAALERAFSAVSVAVRDQNEDGSLPSSVPDSVGMGQQPGPADVASAVAFYLQDACPALLALAAVDPRGDFVALEARSDLEARLAAALGWLETQTDRLRQVDAQAPNRLLHNAVAFQSCAVLTQTSAGLGLAEAFVALALAFQNGDGVLEEAGGTDTSYQAVSLEQMIELLQAGYTDPDGALASALQAGLRWLEGRVTGDGRIDSTDNTRTCGGCEVFLPGDPPKQVSVSAVFRALAYGSASQRRIEAAAADRFIAWLRTRPATSCFEDDGAGQLVPTACP